MKKKQDAKKAQPPEEKPAPKVIPPRNTSMFPDAGPLTDPPTPKSQFLPQKGPKTAAAPVYQYLEPTTIAEACIRASQEIDPNLRVAGGRDVAAMFIRLGELIAQVTK